MSAPDGDPAVSRPAIRRIGRRRVVSAGPTDPAPHDASAEPRAIRRGSQDQTVDDTDAGWGRDRRGSEQLGTQRCGRREGPLAPRGAAPALGLTRHRPILA